MVAMVLLLWELLGMDMQTMPALATQSPTPLPALVQGSIVSVAQAFNAEISDDEHDGYDTVQGVVLNTGEVGEVGESDEDGVEIRFGFAQGGNIQVYVEKPDFDKLHVILAATCSTVGSDGVGAGHPCVFPFTYNGTAYYSCTFAGKSNLGETWCSTETSASESYIEGRWGMCSCQALHIGYRVSVVTSFHSRSDGSVLLEKDRTGIVEKQLFEKDQAMIKFDHPQLLHAVHMSDFGHLFFHALEEDSTDPASLSPSPTPVSTNTSNEQVNKAGTAGGSESQLMVAVVAAVAVSVCLVAASLLACQYRWRHPASAKPPVLKHHFFLSHSQSSGGDQTNTLCLELEKLGYKVWYDNNMSDLTEQGMQEGVRNSDNFILFLSEGVLTRPFVQMEVREAVAMHKNIVLVHEADARHGAFDFAEEALQSPDDLRYLLQQIESIPWQRRNYLRDASIGEILNKAALRNSKTTVNKQNEVCAVSVYSSAPGSVKQKASDSSSVVQAASRDAEEIDDMFDCIIPSEKDIWLGQSVGRPLSSTKLSL